MTALDNAHAGDRDITPAPHGRTLALLTLGLGGLFIGTGEFAAMGLLPDVARSVEVSIPEAGGLISAYALGVVVGSPILAIASARIERRRILVWLAALVLIGNAASAAAPDFFSLIIARFVSGLPHGAFYGTAAMVAAAMVPKTKRAEAIGLVMLGLAAANLVGVPLVTYLGQTFGWRASFALLGAGGALVMALLPIATPRVEADAGASPLRELSALARPQVWLTLAVAAIGFGGMFAVYSYISPTLTEYAGQPVWSVPLFLALWGLGMVVGNVVGGKLADRAQMAAITGMLVWNVVFLALFTPAASGAVTVALALFLIGVGFALVPALQARLMDVAPGAAALAGALNHSAFNLSNALGAWTGGLAIAAGWGWASTGAVAAMLALCGLALFLVAIACERRSVSRDADGEMQA